MKPSNPLTVYTQEITRQFVKDGIHCFETNTSNTALQMSTGGVYYENGILTEDTRRQFFYRPNFWFWLRGKRLYMESSSWFNFIPKQQANASRKTH